MARVHLSRPRPRLSKARASISAVCRESTSPARIFRVRRSTSAQLDPASLEKGAASRGVTLWSAPSRRACSLTRSFKARSLDDAASSGRVARWRADLQGASLDRRATSRARRVNLAQLQGASLNNAQLQGASLAWAQLQGASLNRAQLQGASLDRGAASGRDAHGRGASGGVACQSAASGRVTCRREFESSRSFTSVPLARVWRVGKRKR